MVYHKVFMRVSIYWCDFLQPLEGRITDPASGFNCRNLKYDQIRLFKFSNVGIEQNLQVMGIRGTLVWIRISTSDYRILIRLLSSVTLRIQKYFFSSYFFLITYLQSLIYCFKKPLKKKKLFRDIKLYRTYIIVPTRSINLYM
jgi:hypothetical protein